MKMRKDTIDMTGKTFGNLTVIEVVKLDGRRGAHWKCKCSCGNECIAFGSHLRNGSRISCGCAYDSRLVKTGLNRIYLSYKQVAKKRNLEFSISRETFEKLVVRNCTYCGIEPFKTVFCKSNGKLQLKYNGIDRFDTNKGYTEENCVSCCYYCNHAKLDMSFSDWLIHLKRLCEHQGFINGK